MEMIYFDPIAPLATLPGVMAVAESAVLFPNNDN